VAHDGSPEAESALLSAADLARVTGSRIDLVGVCDEVAIWYGAYLGPDSQAELAIAARSQLEQARARLSDLDEVDVHVLRGDPVRLVRQHAADADLLMLGSRNHGPLARTILGSVSSPLVREPPCPLIVLPRTAIASDGAVDERPARSAATQAG
jgi:nucleotide-binding universal stress UspA family protein